VERDEAWAVLGLTPGAAEHEVRHAWKELVRRYHPDRVAHLGAEFVELSRVRMVRINEAYEVLLTDVELDEPVTDEINPDDSAPDDETARLSGDAASSEAPTRDDVSLFDADDDPADAPTDVADGAERDRVAARFAGFAGPTATILPQDELDEPTAVGRPPLDAVTTWIPIEPGGDAGDATVSDPPSIGRMLTPDEATTFRRVPLSFLNLSDGPPTLLLDADGPTRWQSDGPPTLFLDLPDVLEEQLGRGSARAMPFAAPRDPAPTVDDVDLGEPEDP
jgi:hypothetical protein